MSFPETGELYANRFRIDRLLGKGGFAAVFLAFDSRTRGPVALKILQPDDGTRYRPDTRSRFAREIDLVRRVDHPMVVKLVDAAAPQESALWAAFEYVPGEDLTAVVRRVGKLALGDVEVILRQALLGIGAAHDQGLLHRDIKPANLRVFEGEQGLYTLRILDFGIARANDSGHPSVTKTGELIGTPRYMSPEQLRGVPLTQASDLYSLALVAYELLLGEDALGGGSLLDQMNRVLPGFRFDFRGYEGSRIADVLTAMLRQDPTDRIATSHEALAALDGAPLRATTTLREPMPRRGPTQQRTHAAPEAPAAEAISPKFIALLALVAVAVAVAAALTVVVSSGPKPEQAPVPRPPSQVAGLLSPQTPPASEPPAAPEVYEPAIPEPEFVDWTAPEGQYVYVPGEPGEGRRYPAVLIFQDKHASWPEFVQKTGWKALADKHEFILVGASDPGSWLAKSDSAGRKTDAFDEVLPKIEKVLKTLPLDRAQIFVATHGTGGRIAVHMSRQPFVRALAMHTFNRRKGEKKIIGEPIPTLLIAPKHSNFWPLSANHCQTKYEPFENYEADWRRRNKSRAPGILVDLPADVADKNTAECTRWSGAAVLESCHVSGGSQWPGLGSYDEDDCRIQLAFRNKSSIEDEAKFASTTYVWEFFQRAVAKDVERQE